MRIAICAIGSRGDVQPNVALAMGLKAAGHDVRVFTHRLYEDLVRDHGIEYFPAEGDPRDAQFTQAVADLGGNPIRLSRWLRENFKPVLHAFFQETVEAIGDAELVLNSSLSLAGFHIAEKKGIPAISIQLQPTNPSRATPSSLVPPRPSWFPFERSYNYLTAKFANQVVFHMLRPLLNECRKDVLGLKPLSVRYWWKVDNSRNEIPVIYAYSPTVVPPPPDWGPYKRVSGYWFLDGEQDYVPSQELSKFLDSGSPPVYIGFGSMVDHERAEMTRLVIEALEKAGQRGILHSGWSELGSADLPESILPVDDVPHDWLFPRMAAVVHHGGAGTTAAGLRAGAPSIVVAFFGDQFFWGWRVNELGAGPRWIPRKQLTAEGLAAAIEQAVTDEDIRRHAAAVGEQIQTEDGVATAIPLVERFAAGPAAD